MVAGRSRRLTVWGTTRPAAARIKDHQWDSDLVEIEGGAVPEDLMIAEPLAVVRGDDHHRVVKQPLAGKFIEQLPELLIEESDAVVVAIACHQKVSCSGRILVDVRVVKKELVVPWVLGADPEAAGISRRGHVRVVGVEIVEEGEEGRSCRLPQPAEKGIVDPTRIAGLELDPFLLVEVAASEDVRQDPASRDRAAQEETRRQREILVISKPSIQTRLIIAAVRVGGEPGGLVAPRGQVFSQSRIRRSEGVVPLRIEPVRPLTGEKAAM